MRHQGSRCSVDGTGRCQRADSSAADGGEAELRQADLDGHTKAQEGEAEYSPAGPCHHIDSKGTGGHAGCWKEWTGCQGQQTHCWDGQTMHPGKGDECEYGENWLMGSQVKQMMPHDLYQGAM